MSQTSFSKLMAHSFGGWLMRVESAIYHNGMSLPVVSTVPLLPRGVACAGPRLHGARRFFDVSSVGETNSMSIVFREAV